MSAMIPILYSFRRCPFAIRARLAIYLSKVRVEIREVSLRNKPSEMISISNKATVPILKTKHRVLEESLDIILWALDKKDFYKLLNPYVEDKERTLRTIDIFDNKFKYHLDRYKYSYRYLGNKNFMGKNKHRDTACKYIYDLENIFQNKSDIYIHINKLSILDICLFPLIRQFRIADPYWFDEHFHNSTIKKWLNNLLEQDYFKNVMFKYEEWIKEKKCHFFSYDDNKTYSFKSYEISK